jgi:hypothetical protein
MFGFTAMKFAAFAVLFVMCQTFLEGKSRIGLDISCGP